MHTFEINYCRVCLGTHNLKNIFGEDVIPPTADKIMYCASIQVTPEDCLPSKICSKCLLYLDVSYVFKTVCEWTDHQLRQNKATKRELLELKCTVEPLGNNVLIELNNSNAEIDKFDSNLPQRQDHVMHMIHTLLGQGNLDTLLIKAINDDDIITMVEQHKKILDDCGHSDENLAAQNCSSLNLPITTVATNSENRNDETYSSDKNKPVYQRSDNKCNAYCETQLVGGNVNLLNDVQNILFNESNDLHRNNCSSVHDNLLVNEKATEIERLEQCEGADLLSEERSNIKANAVNQIQYSLDNIDAMGNVQENRSENLFMDKSKKKVLVEKHLAIDEFDSVSNKGIIFQCQRHQDNCYNALFLNTEDTTVNNEKQEMDSRNLEAANSTSQDLDKYFSQQDFSDNVENELNSKAFLKNILLDDFENFEKEKLANIHRPPSENDDIPEICSNNESLSKACVGPGNRVGRHIAKKNAGQPPKRYSPAPPLTSKTALQPLDQKLIKNELEKQLETDSDSVKAADLENVESILDQEYILENDLSMPEAIFEETIVTESFCFVDNDVEVASDEAKETEIRNRPKKGTIYKKGAQQLKYNQKNVTLCKGQIMTDPHSTSSTKNAVRPQKNIRHVSTYDSGIINNFEHELDEYASDSLNSDSDIDSPSNNGHSSHDDYAKPPNTLQQKKKFVTKRRKYKQTGDNNTCKICGKSFPFPSHLRRHLTAHIGVKQFICKYCSKQFLHSYNLSVHLRSHTGNFPLKCNICNRGFASPSVLERHKRSHTGETPYQCQYCLQLFSHASSLNMHEKMHLNRPSFMCDICFKVFSYKSSLTAHKKGHLGLKAHSCGICHKRFTRRTSVMRHMSCHTEGRKFKCRTCGDVFNTQSNLVKHHKVHSNR